MTLSEIARAKRCARMDAIRNCGDVDAASVHRCSSFTEWLGLLKTCEARVKRIGSGLLYFEYNGTRFEYDTDHEPEVVYR